MSGSATPSAWPKAPHYECHTGNVKLFSKLGVTVYGAGSSHLPNPSTVDIVLDLADKYKQWGMPSHWTSAAIANEPVVVDMHIPDMTAPTWVTQQFWVALWADLVGEAKSRGGKVAVLVICFGGHGRTGTVLTALALAAKAIPKASKGGVGLSDPIAWVRSAYCEEAVESVAQINYIRKTFGVKSESKPAKTWGAVSAVNKKQLAGGTGGNGVVRTYGTGFLDDLHGGLD